MAAKTAKKQPARKPAKKSPRKPARKKGDFPKGKSGNPKGRPKGSRNKATILAEELLDGEVEELVRRCIELALEGDQVALKLCMECLIPPRKDRPVTLKLPDTRTPADLVEASAVLLEAVTSGELTPAEGQALGAVLEGLRRSHELNDIDDRLRDLEERLEIERRLNK